MNSASYILSSASMSILSLHPQFQQALPLPALLQVGLLSALQVCHPVAHLLYEASKAYDVFLNDLVCFHLPLSFVEQVPVAADLSREPGYFLQG